MVNLLEQIRAALDTVEPALAGRVVDVEMPRLFVEADDVDALQRVLVAVIGRGVDCYAGTITVRTVKWRGKARLEVTGEQAVASGEAVSGGVAADVAALRGDIGTDGPFGWLAVPLAGENSTE